jgi:hypothetical protein
MPVPDIEPHEDDPRGLKHVGAKIQDKITDVISCDFSNKKRVHLVGIIIV